MIDVVCTARDADQDYFPFNTPVLITNAHGAIAKVGKQGTLFSTLTAIADQCYPVIVAVRVLEGATPEETQSNIIGTTTADGKYIGELKPWLQLPNNYVFFVMYPLMKPKRKKMPFYIVIILVLVNIPTQ